MPGPGFTFLELLVRVTSKPGTVRDVLLGKPSTIARRSECRRKAAGVHTPRFVDLFVPPSHLLRLSNFP